MIMVSLRDSISRFCRWMNHRSAGFTLPELLVTLSLLVIVLAVGYAFYFFGNTTFSLGEQRVDLQQNARMAADFITRELRIAERVVIVDDYNELDAIDYDDDEQYYLYYIFARDGSLYYQKAEEDAEPVKLLAVISDKIDFALQFAVSETDNKILQFNLAAVDRADGRSFSLDTEVLILNLDQIEDHAGGTGSALIYQIPAPPNPAIRNITLEPQSHVFEPGYSETVQVAVQTVNVPGGSAVNAEFWHLADDNSVALVEGVAVNPSEPVILDGRADFELHLPADLHFGYYYLQVAVEGVSFPQLRYYYIYPQISNIKVAKEPGEPHYAVTVDTGGVPANTVAIVELVERTDNYEDESLSFELEGSPLVREDGTMQFIIKIHPGLVPKNKVLKITIGKLIEESAPF